MTEQNIEQLARHRKVPSWVLKLVADAISHEREACAKLADSELGNTSALMSMPPKSSAAWNIAAAIRARGNK